MRVMVMIFGGVWNCSHNDRVGRGAVGVLLVVVLVVVVEASRSLQSFLSFL